MTHVHNNDIETRLLRLEEALGDSIPGTTIQRILTDIRFAKQQGLAVPDERATSSVVCWCVAIGPHSLAKAMFYGHTIDEALTKAEKAVADGKAKPYTINDALHDLVEGKARRPR